MSTIWDSLDEGFFMFWQTLWALVLGFVLSGAVQAFVSRRAMVATIGDHRPAAITRASLFGMASSSCSYAASALARSLFGRGADFTASIVFMVASTNLVLELGLVMWLLLGWQFAVAEFVGGAIMIALLAATLPRVARRELQDQEPQQRADLAVEDFQRDDALGARLRDPVRRRAAARYTLADLTMLRREIVIGFVVAGFIAIAVPTSVWTAVFVTGHGALTSIENAIVGPIVAFASFVCSIGNVPLGAALWQRGVSFGGVIAFIFADLLSLPLVLIYRKLYGARLTVRLVAVMWFAMSLAGLLTEAIMRALDAVPERPPMADMTSGRYAWDHTTILNIAAVVVFAIVVYVARRPASDDANRHAVDPVCGMQVEKAHAPATLGDGENRSYFCSERCRDHYAKRLESVS